LPNGHAVLPALRLSEQQRDRLSGFVSLTEPRELRRLLGMTPELIGQAVAGRELPGEVVARITAFLASG
jgi:hypothetical protein